MDSKSRQTDSLTEQREELQSVIGWKKRAKGWKGDAEKRNERNYGRISPFTLSPPVRYQASEYSITPEPNNPKTVSLSSQPVSLNLQLGFGWRLQTYIIFYCTGLVGHTGCYLWSCKIDSLPSQPQTTSHDLVIRIRNTR